ncbi:sugar phosphate isomerase/epimerase [soil metagenome]
MNTSRRTFLKNTAFTVAGAAFFNNQLFAFQRKNEIVGIQLYSVREDMKKDPKGTMQQIAEIGYKDVEHANYVDGKFYVYSPGEFKKVLDDLGLSMSSGHTVLKRDHYNASQKEFTDEWKKLVDDAAVVGQIYVISPSMEESARRSYDDLVSFMEVFNKSGELCQKAGMKFGYHNHAFEFSERLNNQTLYDIILKNTDPDLVVHQLDIGNMVGGGGEAMEILKRYPGRFELMHVKDVIPVNDSKYESTIIGTGRVGTKEVMDWGRKSGGTRHFVVEQEAYQDNTPLEAARKNFQIMKQWGYIS